MWLILIGKAFASVEIPSAPMSTEAKPGECSSAIPVGVGRRIAVGDAECKAECSGVLMPTSMATDLIKIEQWGWQVHETCIDELTRAQNLLVDKDRDNAGEKLRVAAKWFGIGFAAGAISFGILEITSD